MRWFRMSLRWLWPWRWLGVLVISSWVWVLLKMYQKPELIGAEKLEEIYPWTIKAKPATGIDWMGLYIKGKKIGYVRTVTSPEKGGTLIEQSTRMQMRLFGSSQRVLVSSKVHVNQYYTLKRFKFSLRSNLSRFSAEGRVFGKYLHVSVKTGGTVRNFQRKYRPSLLASVLRPYIASLKAKPGKKIRTILFDPQSMSYVPTTVEVLGYETLKIKDKTFKALKLRQYFRGMKMLAWIDDKGRALKEISAGGMMLLRESSSDARRHIRQDVDMIGETKIPLNGRIYQPKQRSALHLMLENISLSAFPDLDKGRQRLKGRRLLIRKEKLATFPRVPFSVYASTAPSARSSASLSSALKATALVQSDHPKILEQAIKIMKRAPDRLSALRALNTWVHDTLRKKNVIGIPSALETLQTRVGDCNEHATLFAALARSVSIPCHIVSGIAYMKGHFFYHAWNECHISKEQWLTVDSTWGQLPADVTHVAFVRGGLERQVSLIQLMGKLKIRLEL